MEFFGIIASKQLVQGQKFGPFPGNIAQTVDPSVLNYSFISQVSRGGGRGGGGLLRPRSLDAGRV